MPRSTDIVAGRTRGRDRRVDGVAADGNDAARADAPARAQRQHARRSTRLSIREKEVLRLVVEGKDNATIAQELFISPYTVKNHISNILLKLSVENRLQAAVARFAIRWSERPVTCIGPAPCNTIVLRGGASRADRLSSRGLARSSLGQPGPDHRWDR